jgi:LmbE family N-acetylglucosaminyl deacetylase
MTGHPDHRARSAWTTAAWVASGARARLLYATLTPDFHAEWGTLNDQIGLWMYRGGPVTPDHDLAVYVALDGADLDRKIDALRAHVSQTAGLVDEVGEETFRQRLRCDRIGEASRTRSCPVRLSQASPTWP